MDWLSKRKFVIVCYEKVVRIPLEGDEIFQVHRERTLEAAKALMNAKVDEPRISDIPVAPDITDVFPEYLLGLPPQRQVEFRIDLVPGATPVAKSLYRLAPSEMQELSRQLQELQDKGLYRIHDDIWLMKVEGTREEHEVSFELYNSKEWNSSDDQLRLRWMIYLVVLADAAGSVRDAIRFEYNLASLRGWTKSPVLWAEIGESSLIGLELVLETADKVIKVDKTLYFVEEPIEIMDQEIRKLKHRKVVLVKVKWNSKRGPEMYKCLAVWDSLRMELPSFQWCDKATVRRDLQLEDANGVDCLPNATSFEQLTLVGVPVENVADEAVYEERDDSLERATTTATDLDAEQDRGNISKTQSKATPNEPSSIGTSSGGKPRRQETIGDRSVQTRFESLSKQSYDSPLGGVNTPRSDEDRIKLKELMEICTKLSERVLDLETTKTAQAKEITNLKKRVKKLERKKKSRTHGLKRLYKVGLSARIDSSDDEAKTGEPVVNAATTTSIIPVSAAKDLSDVDMTLAQALAELKSAKPKAVTTAATTTTTVVTRPKAKGLVIQEQEQASTPITSSKDKGKGIMVEEPLKMKKKDQVLFDEQEAIRLQA
ncbi:hypothetical protein Tco_0551214 [Tanacetum coccineum]